MIKEISSDEYLEYMNEQHDHSFLQTQAMAETIHANGAEIRYLALIDDNQTKAVGLGFIQKIFRGQRMDFMAGAVANNSEDELLFYDQLRTYAKNEHIDQLGIQPNHNQQTFDFNGNPTSDENHQWKDSLADLDYELGNYDAKHIVGLPKFQYLKDLTPYFPNDEKGLLKSFNKNSQRKIKKAIELGITIRHIDFEEISNFRKITTETAQRQGFVDKSQKYYESLYKEFGDKADFLQAELDLPASIDKLQARIDSLNPDKKQDLQKIQSLESDVEAMRDILQGQQDAIIPLANMIMIYLEDESTYFLGGSYTDYQKFPAPFLLQYEAMKRTMDRKIRLYNFYGISGDFDGSDGILRFKQNFNGFIQEKVGTFYYFPNALKFKSIQFLKNIMNKILKRG